MAILSLRLFIIDISYHMSGCKSEGVCLMSSCRDFDRMDVLAGKD